LFTSHSSGLRLARRQAPRSVLKSTGLVEFQQRLGVEVFDLRADVRVEFGCVEPFGGSVIDSKG
jgi:hypothetical protein